MARPWTEPCGSDRPLYTPKDTRMTITLSPCPRHGNPRKGRRKPSGTVNAANCVHVKRRRVDPSTETRVKQELMSIWTQTIRSWYPDLHMKTYMKPPVHFNRVHYATETIRGQRVDVLTPAPQMSDTRGDEAQRRIHHVLSRLFAGPESDEVMFIVSQLDFDNYLNAAGTAQDVRGSERRVDASTVNGDSSEGGQSKQTAHNRHDVFEVHARGDCLELSERSSTSTALANGLGTFSTEDLFAFPRPRDLEPSAQRGTFDILIIHRRHGIVVFEVKAMGDAFILSPDLHHSIIAQHEVIRKKIGRSLQQLDKEERVLRYLLKDLSQESPLRVTKGLILPNLEKRTVQAAVMQDPKLVQHLLQCLSTDTLEVALQKCIFSDQLPPFGQALQTTDDIIKRLRSHWWPKLVGSSVGKGLSDKLYEAIIARFGGPATTQFVTTARESRAEVSTLQQAVLETSRCFRAPVVTSEQVNILQDDSPRVYLTGPPGTGKTSLLVLKSKQLLQEGRTVLVVSLWEGSEAVSGVIHREVSKETRPFVQRLRLVLSRKRHFENVFSELMDLTAKRSLSKQRGKAQTILTQNVFTNYQNTTGESLPDNDSDTESGEEMMGEAVPAASTSYPEVEYRAHNGKDVRATSGVYEYSPTSVKARAFSLGHTQRPHSRDKQDKVHVILDEAPWFLDVFVKRLEAELGKDGVVIWAASSFPSWRPKSFKEVVLTQSLRCPPVVVREMTKSRAYATFVRHDFTSLDTGVLSSMPSPTDGPPVKSIRHEGHERHGKQRREKDIWECKKCGEAVARFLVHDLQIGTRGQPEETIRFSDVLISGYIHSLDDVTADTVTSFTSCTDSSDTMDFDISSTSPKQRTPGFVRGLQAGGVLVDVIKRGDRSGVDRLVAPEKTDLVQIAEPESVLGLERAVVVVIGTTDLSATYPRHVDPCFDVMARCTSQLVVVEG